MNCRHRDLRFNIQRNHKKRTTDFAGIKVIVTMTLIIYNNAEENAIENRRKNWLAGCGPDKMIIQMQ